MASNTHLLLALSILVLNNFSVCSSLRPVQLSTAFVSKTEPKEDSCNPFANRYSQIDRYFKDRGIDVKEVPKAIVLYEITSAGIMFAIWGLCYFFRPLERGVILANSAKPGVFDTALARGKKLFHGSKRESALRLATAYAEGAVLRTAVKPVLIPLKLFLTWKMQQLVNGWNALSHKLTKTQVSTPTTA